MINRLPSKKMFKIVATDAAILACILVVVELMLQLVAPQYSQMLYDHDYTGSCPIALNQQGYRGDPLPVEKQPNEFRILALGDSVTFGTGTSAQNTWPLQLKNICQEKLGRPVTVMNVGMPGASLAELTYSFETNWSKYQPDVVAVAVSGNMVSLALIRQSDEPRPPRNGFETEIRHSTAHKAKISSKRFIHKFCLPSFLSQTSQRAMYRLGVLNHKVDPDAPFGALLAYGFAQGDLPRTKAEKAWDILSEDLGEIASAAKERGARLVVTFTPSRFQISERTRDNVKLVPQERLTIDPVERLQAICNDCGVAYANALEQLRRYRKETAGREGFEPDMYVPFDYTHLDKDGHRALAGALYDVLQMPPELHVAAPHNKTQ